MATTDLKLERQGSLAKPGPIGRLVRLALGLLCLWYVYRLWQLQGDFITEAGSIRPLVGNGILPSLILISYVINIGFSRAWKKWPAINKPFVPHRHRCVGIYAVRLSRDRVIGKDNSLVGAISLHAPWSSVRTVSDDRDSRL